MRRWRSPTSGAQRPGTAVARVALRRRAADAGGRAHARAPPQPAAARRAQPRSRAGDRLERLMPVVRQYALDSGCSCAARGAARPSRWLEFPRRPRLRALTRRHRRVRARAEVLRHDRNLLVSSYLGEREAARAHSSSAREVAASAAAARTQSRRQPGGAGAAPAPPIRVAPAAAGRKVSSGSGRCAWRCRGRASRLDPAAVAELEAQHVEVLADPRGRDRLDHDGVSKLAMPKAQG